MQEVDRYRFLMSQGLSGSFPQQETSFSMYEAMRKLSDQINDNCRVYFSACPTDLSTPYHEMIGSTVIDMEARRAKLAETIDIDEATRLVESIMRDGLRAIFRAHGFPEDPEL